MLIFVKKKKVGPPYALNSFSKYILMIKLIFVKVVGL